MDFALSEVQEEIKSLVRGLLDKQITLERLNAVEQSEDRLDRKTWTALADANVLGLAIPEAYGGSGLGLEELAVALEEVGRHVAQVPLLACAGWAGRAITQFGSADQRQQFLPGIVDGTTFVTAAFDEPANYDSTEPTVRASHTDQGWMLNGLKVAVPWLALCSHVLVTARTADDAVGVFIVATEAPGVTTANGYSTSRQPAGTLELRDVLVPASGVVGDPSDSEVALWVYDNALACQLAVAMGVIDQDLLITAKYDSERLVFGRPIATFQAAAMRLADSYIDSEAIKVTAWSAIWRFEQGLPARDALAVAKWWVADGGQRVVHAGQHLHGGTGVDLDYPLHRYFLWAKELEMGLGGGTQQALRLGASVVAG